MFDTMTLTKTVGALCGALLVFLLFGWAGEALFHTGGHGTQQAYVIPTGEDDGAVEEEVAEVDFQTVYADADPAAGERLWRQCSACHALEQGENGVGPYLYNVVGRAKHSVDGYDYSSAFLELTGDWTPENLSAFIEDPRDYAPGTAMAYNGMDDVEDRANLIAYLATFSD